MAFKVYQNEKAYMVNESLSYKVFKNEKAYMVNERLTNYKKAYLSRLINETFDYCLMFLLQNVCYNSQ